MYCSKLKEHLFLHGIYLDILLIFVNMLYSLDNS